MATILFAFLFMLLMVTIMAVGVMLGRAPISGSCGGMKALGMDVECEICGGDETVCNEENAVGKKIARLLTKRVGK